jgi:hypothetical protein
LDSALEGEITDHLGSLARPVPCAA